MINAYQKKILKENWGDKADCLSCLAEVRLYDALSFWQCFIYAMNPENENEIMCIVSAGKNLQPENTEWTMSEISSLYNSDGEGVEMDFGFRPRRALEILKTLEIK